MIELSVYQALSFKKTQRLGKHFLRDVWYFLLNLGIVDGTLGLLNNGQHRYCPFATKMCQYIFDMSSATHFV